MTDARQCLYFFLSDVVAHGRRLVRKEYVNTVEFARDHFQQGGAWARSRRSQDEAPQGRVRGITACVQPSLAWADLETETRVFCPWRRARIV